MKMILNAGAAVLTGIAALAMSSAPAMARGGGYGGGGYHGGGSAGGYHGATTAGRGGYGYRGGGYGYGGHPYWGGNRYGYRYGYRGGYGYRNGYGWGWGWGGWPAYYASGYYPYAAGCQVWSPYYGAYVASPYCY